MEKTTNKMGAMKVNKLMLATGIPMIISMVLQAFYNIVDSAFVSNMASGGEAALNALTLAFPVQMLMIAVSIGTGVGMNALLSKSLGAGDKETAAKTAGNAQSLAGIIFILCVLFGFLGTGGYISTQTKNEEIYIMGTEYLHICCTFSLGIIFFAIYEKLLQSTGLSVYSTIAQVLGALTNIVLDPILIYGLLGLPEMGVRGAAYATVIGQHVSMISALIFHYALNREVKNGVKYLKLSADIVRRIYSIGLPAIIAQALMSVMTYGLNLILVRVDEMMVTAYGLFYKIQQFILFAAFGLRDAITPIVSFNHGMKDRQRVIYGMKYGIGYTLIIMVFGLIALESFAKPISSLFGLSGETQGLCVVAMRIISVSFVFAGFNIAAQGIFQALDSGVESLIISVCRQCLFVLPVAWAFSLPALKSMDSAWLVWVTFPIAEIASAAIAVVFMKHVYDKKIKTLG